MATFTVKGTPATAGQRNAADFLLAICKQNSASLEVMQAMIFAAIMESDLGIDLGWNGSNPRYGGILAGDINYFGHLGGAASLTVWKAQAEAFIKGPTGSGYNSAVTLSGSYPDFGLLAVHVEAPVLPGGGYGPTGYGQYASQGGLTLINLVKSEAIAFVQRGGGASTVGGSKSTSSAGSTQAPFQVGQTSNPSEDFWTAINRLAQARYWYSASLDTPVPTPGGWTTMGAVREGHYVFGTDGRPIKVVKAFPIRTDRECFRVEFRDGSAIVVDGDHPWPTRLGTLSTREMADSVVETRTDSPYPRYQHKIPAASSLDLPDADLPIDPYILGYWLGDGGHKVPRFTVGRRDRDHLVAEIERAGLTITNEWYVDGGASQIQVTIKKWAKRGSLPSLLRGLDVFGNKHIPVIYLRASRAQRVALLQGLMDSDGGMRRHSCAFTNVNQRLADDVRELVRTLGLRPRRSVRKGGREILMPQGHVSVARDIVSINFATTTSFCPFRLSRKVEGYEAARATLRHQYGNHHTVKAIERVPTVPVRCIEVESDDHLFLIGDAMVPTHNCFSDGETLYLADGVILMQQPPVMTIDRHANADIIVHLDFVWDNCCHVNTPVPTPDGWTTMGEVHVGDVLLGADGLPVSVTRASPIYKHRVCYRMVFDDGTSIVADASHRWPVRQGDGRALRTTEEIYRSTERTYIPLAAPLELPEQELLVDPYVLGYWLGDGSKSTPMIGTDDKDIDELLRHVEAAGYRVNLRKKKCTGPWAQSDFYWRMTLLAPETSTTCATPGCAGLVQARGLCPSCYARASYSKILPPKKDTITQRLRALGVLEDKRVPAAYLRASREQRLALLQGLMDSDGSVGGRRCEIAQVDEALASDVLELVRGLGYKASLTQKSPRGNNKRTLHLVSFTALSDRPVPFRLSRKARRAEAAPATTWRAAHKRVVSVEPHASVPVKCVAVDNDDHLFLAGDGMTVTSNTAFQYVRTHKRRKKLQRKSALAKVSSPVMGNLQVVCKIDQVRAGDVVKLTGCGPGDGKWLVGDCRRSIYNVFSELTLVPAVQPLTEAQVAGAGNNDSINPAAASNPGSGTIMAAMLSAASTINNAHIRYVYGGGHAQVGHTSIGSPGQGYDGTTKGFDCSGAVGAVLAAAGLLSGSIGSDTDVIRILQANRVLLDGQGSGTPECTLFDNSGTHIFMRLNGRYFGTSDGGGTPTAGGGSGGAWISPGSDTATFKAYHIPQNILTGSVAGGNPAGAASPATPSTTLPAGGFFFPLLHSVVSAPSTWTLDQGVDMAAPGHATEYAVGSGKIVGRGISGFGPSAPILELDRPFSGTSYTHVYYGHAGLAGPPVGTTVPAGGVIGEVGAGIVGISTGPHLEIGFCDSSGTPTPGSASTMMRLLKAAY